MASFNVIYIFSRTICWAAPLPIGNDAQGGLNVTGLNHETAAACDRRTDRLAAFRTKYGPRMPLENQPSGRTLSQLVKFHGRRSPEFVALDKVTNAIDGRNTGKEPIRLSEASPVLIDTYIHQIGKRSSDYNSSPESFAHAVRVLMWG